MAIHSMQDLEDGELDQVSGGYIHDHNNKEGDWEVIDDSTGEVLARQLLRSQAERKAAERGLSTKRLSWEELVQLRETGSVTPRHFWYEWQ